MELRIGRRGLLATLLATAVAGFVPAAIAGPMHNVAAHADGTNNGKHLGQGKGTTTAPDPCTVLRGPASYYDTPPTDKTEIISPFLSFHSDLGTYSGDPSNAEGPLCSGYTYTITVTSLNGSPLGWLTSSSSSGTTVTPASDPSSPTETIEMTPTTAGQNLSIFGSTNGYMATATACGGVTSLHVTAVVLSPDGTKTTYDHLGPSGDSTLCATVSSTGGTSFYG